MNDILQAIYALLPDNLSKKITAKDLREALGLMDSKITDAAETITLIAATGAQSLGTITTTSTIPAEGNVWGFAGEGTYPNAGNLTVSPNTLGILTRVGTTWSKVEVPVSTTIEDGSVTPEKTSFFVTGVNMVNPNKTIQGKAVNEVTGGIFDIAGYQSHTDIKVKPNTSYYFNVNVRYAWLDSGGNYISGAINSTYTNVVLQSPSNAAFISFSSWSGDSLIMAESDVPVDFVPYEMVLNSELLPEFSPEQIPDGTITEEMVQFVKKQHTQKNQYLFGAGNWESLLTSTSNVAIGYEAMASNISSGWNVVIGTRAAKNQKSENGNVVIGADAAMNAETICDCAYVGWEAGLNVKGGVGDTGMGRRSLGRAQWAGNNTGYGDSTLFRTVTTENGNTGFANVAIGYVAMEYGMNNTATIGIGRGTGRLINSTDNVLIGDSVYYGSESSISWADREGDTVDVPWSASSVTAIGTKAMYQAGNGANETTAVGKMSLLNVASIRNTAVGAFSGTNVTTGLGNTLLGYNANTSAGGVSNSIAIGYQVVATKSNQVVIGSVNNDEFVICGVTFTKAQLQALKNLVS